MKPSPMASRTPFVIPRPSATSGMQARVVSLPSAELVEVPRAKPPSVPPPVPSPIVVDALLRALRELDREPDTLSGVRMCLEAFARIIPCRVSVVHLFDPSRRDFLVVDARGEGAESMLLGRSSKDDPLLRIAMQRGEPFAWDDLRRAPVVRLPRFAELGHVTSALVCPMVGSGVWLGAIELVDPLRGGPFRAQEVNGGREVARRLAALISRCGVVTDIATIARSAAHSWLR